MTDEALYKKTFSVQGGDFEKAGEISTRIKEILKSTGIKSTIIRRVAIASFEAEMNVVIHANSGRFEFTLTPDSIIIVVDDKGPGIENIELAMKEGYSTASDEMREMGFGAGMGLPNIKKTVDDFKIETTVGKGTKLRIKINLNHS
ncbi:MAG TPA: anti-sigma regulatory factor [Firmicutes bacterium]|nr:anti-sigma regulatory factor [Bacillota bacterium]